jgi:glycosyltransferase involved in cell wall biosynthesis
VSTAPGARLTIAGEDTSTAPDGGSMREYLARRITELGVNSSVHLVGYVPHEAVPSLLDSAALCVFPSRWEGMPVSVVEAMARGKCVIVSPAPAMVEVVDDAVSGVIADAEDPMVFATAIVNLLADAERRARLGKAAREKAAREFAVDVVLDRTLALYRDAQRKRAAQ